MFTSSERGHVPDVVTRERRRIQNQELFRLANERLDEHVDDLALDGSPIPFLCECADDDCLGRVDLTRDDYEAVRSQRNRYVILPGHATIASEVVIEKNGDYYVVEKENDGSR
jgi:hypothetical protein